MFDVGFWEILLILVLALVVIGPERLPGAARKVGFFVGKARRYIEGVRSEVESELDVNEFKRMLHNQEVQINELQQQLKAGANEVQSDIKSNLPDDISVNDILEDTPTHSFQEEKTSNNSKQSSASEKPESESTTAITEELVEKQSTPTAIKD